ncbi:hypothetical protein MM221_20790 [Salipaludibacillus sp. LMS25]|jgi:hypothetical protein|uniref:hypothetical protein n=1 Tax=Salipaludibacillus sp. LMS25 TaxID=2924031 RepID=UPI0020D14594|nr:hypothetical protein [Salipaludibacillus sp. LMS25]UTR14939.1 hypothetical protein MM221_20790 [Salipaludibacillus sp. LMS25]
MLKQFFSMSVLALLFLLTPVTHVFADENSDGASLMEGPFVIIAFATLIVMIYYTIKD